MSTEAKANLITPIEIQCCSRPAIAVMDYERLMPGGLVSSRVHRVCTRCFAHWFGSPGRIRKYRRKEWDSLINTDYQLDRVEAYLRNFSEWTRLWRIEAMAREYVERIGSKDIDVDIDTPFNELQSLLGMNAKGSAA